MSMKIDGLEDFQREIERLEKKTEEISGEHNVPIDQLLTDTFLSKHSRFASADELFDASGFTIESQEDFDAIPDDQWDEFIRNNTSFNSWEDMLQEAGAEWFRRKLS